MKTNINKNIAIRQILEQILYFNIRENINIKNQ